MRVSLGQLIDEAYKDLLKAEHGWNIEGRSGLRDSEVAAIMFRDFRIVSMAFDTVSYKRNTEVSIIRNVADFTLNLIGLDG